MSDAKTIVKNVGVLAIAEIINSVLSFLLIIAIARVLGDVGLGKYSFAFAFVGLFMIVSDIGFSQLVIREVAKNKRLAEKYFRNYLTIKLLLSSLLLVLPTLVILFFHQTTEIIVLVFLASLSTFFYSMTYPFVVIFNAFERMEYLAWTRLVERIFAFCIGLFVLLKGYGIIIFMAVFIISQFAGVVYATIILKKRFVKIALDFDIKFWKTLLRESWPFWLSAFFITIYFKIGTVMLSLMKDYVVTGWYNAAYKIIDILFKVPAIIITAVFPALSKFNVKSFQMTRLLYEKAFHYLFLIAVPIAVITTLLAKDIILLIYKDQFLPSVSALQILIWVSIFIFVNYLMGYLLSSIGKQRLFTYSTGICCVINIILNIILIPKYSYIGAGIATVLTEIINFGILYYLTAINRYGLNLPKVTIKPIIAGILTGLFIWYFKWINFFVLVFLGVIVYIIVLIILRDLGKEEADIAKLFVKKGD